VLATPKSRFPWLLPVVAAVGGLGLLVFTGRRWVRKGREDLAARRRVMAAAPAAEDQYVDKLDDELSETD